MYNDVRVPIDNAARILSDNRPAKAGHLPEETDMTKTVPTRPEGWKFAGAAGEFTVWHAGKNDYRITRSPQGEVIAQRNQFGLAHAFARFANDFGL